MATSTKPVALVTGASSGIGRALAKLFAGDGYHVVLVARRKAVLHTLATELTAGPGSAQVLAADLADPHTPSQIYAEMEGAGHAVACLVNNAGFGAQGAFVATESQILLDMITVNISALVHLTRLFLPGMLESGAGKILNIGSTAGFQPGPYMANYYATKAFVNHFSEALTHEVRGTGVSVTVSCPGATATEFADVAGVAGTPLFQWGAAPAETVAREAYQAMHQGRRMVVHGLKNRLSVWAQRVAPREMVQRVASRLNRLK